jgi:dihydroflavonol-4-reductase
LNVDLSVTLARESARQGVQKIIMISSTGVVSGRPDGKPSGENDPTKIQIPGNGYQESKKRMETALLALDSGGSEIVIVRPGWMWGPGDFAPTAAGQIVRDMLKQKTFQFVAGTPFGIVDARDVAYGIAQIVSGDKPSKIYHLAGNNITALEAIQSVAREIGTVKVHTVPYKTAIFLSGVLEFFTKITGSRNPLPREGVEVISKGVLISSELAKKELGVTFRPFAETARDTVAFVRSNWK